MFVFSLVWGHLLLLRHESGGIRLVSDLQVVDLLQQVAVRV